MLVQHGGSNCGVGVDGELAGATAGDVERVGAGGFGDDVSTEFGGVGIAVVGRRLEAAVPLGAVGGADTAVQNNYAYPNPKSCVAKWYVFFYSRTGNQSLTSCFFV